MENLVPTIRFGTLLNLGASKNAKSGLTSEAKGEQTLQKS